VRDVRKKGMSLFDHTTAWVEGQLVRDRHLSRFVAVSGLTREHFLREYPEVDPARVSVLHPGVDMERFRKHDRGQCRAGVRQQFGIHPAATVVLFVSMNYDIKGLDYLMAGLARFKGKYPQRPCKLLIVGKGSDRKYLSLAAGLGIGDDVIYAGVVQNGDMARMYLAADIFAMLSRCDTFGLTVLEAIAASLPVMISGNVGARDLIRQGENGFIIGEPMNPDEVADTVSLLGNGDVALRVGREAHGTASRHSWERYAEKTKELFDLCLAHNTASKN
jgi:glycosyltransferase involved in cell wall biosynthesis